MIARSLLGAAAFALNVTSVSAQHIGTNTTVDPYVVPSVDDVKTVSIMTVKDLPAGNGYNMVGIPDGLGAFGSIALKTGREDESDKKGEKPGAAHQFTLLMDHELGATAGTEREHGSKGAFISEWTIDRSTLEVVNGQDLTDSPAKVYTWDGTA